MRRRPVPWLLRARMLHGWRARTAVAVLAVAAAAVLLVLPLVLGPRVPPAP